MYYVVNSKLIDNKSVYDILYEANTIREAYDFLYNNNYKPTIQNAFKSSHFHNELYDNVSIWKETDLDQILIDYVNYALNQKEDYLGYKFDEDTMSRLKERFY